MDNARTTAIMNAVLPQDFLASAELVRSEEWLPSRRSEQRLIGKFMAPGILLGGCTAVLLHSSVLTGMGAGTAIALLAGLARVAWQRRAARP
jgi:hypothetical protein